MLLATGSRSFRPPNIPFDDPDIFDSESLFALQRIPKNAVVVGGGAIGWEYASIFTAVGVSVTLVDSSERLLAKMDGELSQLAAGVFENRGCACCSACASVLWGATKDSCASPWTAATCCTPISCCLRRAQCTALIQGALSKRQLLPSEQFVDAAYVDAELLVKSASEYDITLVGPTQPPAGWQRKVAGAYSQDQFTIDWDRQRVRCPQGKWSLPWREPQEPSRDLRFPVHFRLPDCVRV